MHPIELVYKHLTGVILSNEVEGAVESTMDCSGCKRTPAEYGGKAFTYANSYKMTVTMCPCCQSFFVSNALMGVERVNGKSGSAVYQKFGMMKSVGWVLEVNTGRNVLLVPQKIYDKFPPEFLAKIDTRVVLPSQHLKFIADGWQFPLLYIKDFGRSTESLIQGLQVSPSPDQLLCCCDDGLNNFNRALYTVDLKRVMVLAELMRPLPSGVTARIKKAIIGSAYGRVSPSALTKEVNDIPQMKAILAEMPRDPHVRISMLNQMDVLLSNKEV